LYDDRRTKDHDPMTTKTLAPISHPARAELELAARLCGNARERGVLERKAAAL
jgi:hypothetical protein